MEAASKQLEEDSLSTHSLKVGMWITGVLPHGIVFLIFFLHVFPCNAWHACSYYKAGLAWWQALLHARGHGFYPHGCSFYLFIYFFLFSCFHFCISFVYLCYLFSNIFFFTSILYFHLDLFYLFSLKYLFVLFIFYMISLIRVSISLLIDYFFVLYFLYTFDCLINEWWLIVKYYLFVIFLDMFDYLNIWFLLI